MRLIKILPLLAFWAMTAVSMRAGADVKSYREWKSERVTHAETKVNFLKAQLTVKKAQRGVANGTDPNLAMRNTVEAVSTHNMSVERMERQLREEVYALEIAKDLSVTDYFVGYLTKVQDQQAAFSEVAGKLSSEEIAELMMAYANSVFGGSSTNEIPASAANISKDSAK